MYLVVKGNRKVGYHGLNGHLEAERDEERI
jgi:hypothetical protein